MRKTRALQRGDEGFWDMVFGAFSKMISNMPVQAVIKAIELECKMLESDKENHRVTLDEDAYSILSFGQFIRRVKAGEAVRLNKLLPLDHLEFYRETIVRLVNAGELPASTMEQFENAFPLIPSSGP